MSNRRVAVFFYGSYMNRSVLERLGFVPERVEVARLSGFDISIRPLATLVRSDRHSVWGIVSWATHEELARLYSSGAMTTYLPEPVVVETQNGMLLAGLCYIGPESADPRPPASEYLERIAGAARENGFPTWYVQRVESFATASGS